MWSHWWFCIGWRQYPARLINKTPLETKVSWGVLLGLFLNTSMQEDDELNENSQSPEDVEAVRSRWKTRRFMAWIVLFFFMFTVLLGFFYVPADKLEHYATLFNIIALFCTGVIGSYFGFATYDDVKSGIGSLGRPSGLGTRRRMRPSGRRISSEDDEEDDHIPPYRPGQG